MRRRSLFGAAAILATTLLPLSAFAEYPENDIRVVVPWGAGGGTDGILRGKLGGVQRIGVDHFIVFVNIGGGIGSRESSGGNPGSKQSAGYSNNLFHHHLLGFEEPFSSCQGEH